MSGPTPTLRLPLLVEAPVYGWERLVLLKHLLDQGLSKAAIARQLDVSRRSVYHWITTGQLGRDLVGGSPRVRAGRPRKLEPYTSIITTRLATYPELSAVRLFEEIRAAGGLAVSSSLSKGFNGRMFRLSPGA